MDAFPVRVKDPSAKLDYGFEWGSATNDGSPTDKGWLQGDSITLSSWAVAAVAPGTGTPTLSADGNDLKSTLIWMDGGVNGEDYLLTNHIETAAGRKNERSFLIKVRQK